TEAAAKAYHAVVAEGAGRQEASGEEHMATAAAAMSVALAELRAAAQDPALKDKATEAWMSVASPVGARFLEVIGRGQEINVKDYLSAAGPTIFYFGSANCPSCQDAKPLIERLALEQQSYRIYHVEIDRPGADGIDFESPVAKQFKLEAVPELKVYQPDGTLAAEGDEAIEKVNELLVKQAP
ncbi:MAG: thioredoxin family protein, partial [Armatimonadetes bacterium]|nr:thioredoxin family protein [Armatimonadota bacterium]